MLHPFLARSKSLHSIQAIIMDVYWYLLWLRKKLHNPLPLHSLVFSRQRLMWDGDTG
jgi:hypothetical protein